jgi:signal transduction histidine kinase
MKKILKNLQLLIFVVLPLAGYSQVVIDNDWTYQFVESNCKILLLKTEADFDNQEIVKGKIDKQFVAFDTKHISGKESISWLKLSLENKSKKAQTVYVGTTRFEQISLWIKTDSSIIGPQINGQNIAFDEKPVKIQGLSFFKFDLKQSQKVDLYLKTINKNASILPKQVIPLVLTNESHFISNYEKPGDYTFLFLGAAGIMIFFNFLLFVTTRIKVYFYYSMYALFVTAFNLGLVPQFAYPLYGHMDINLFPISTAGTAGFIFIILVAQEIMEIKKYMPKRYKFLNLLILFFLIPLFTGIFSSLKVVTTSINFLTSFIVLPTIFGISIIMTLKKHIPSRVFFYGTIMNFSGVLILMLALLNIIPLTIFGIPIIIIYEFFLLAEMALFSLGISVRINEMKHLKNQEEFERFRAEQLKIENEEINLQRNKAEKALKELKITQAQLIQKEKLASLGELTAGIAHEIQNPLNFVNNFSELSIELIEELGPQTPDGGFTTPPFGGWGAFMADLVQNQQKINFHGKRASSIVKGMLEHSRASTGVKELTDINKLADEYLRLSYHGLKAKNKDFNSDFLTEFDEKLPKINVIPQDIGRVLLNLVNNAFYAVGRVSSPSVKVETKYADNQIIIKVQDNGNGMNEDIKAKIFQPFFTTKPTGQGTGLGLSLAYDIVTKGHGGTIECESVEGEGTTFVVRLPIS